MGTSPTDRAAAKARVVAAHKVHFHADGRGGGLAGGASESGALAARGAGRAGPAPIVADQRVDATPKAALVRIAALSVGPGESRTSPRLVGHSGTRVTELVYRHELRPVMPTGATAMDSLFGSNEV